MESSKSLLIALVAFGATLLSSMSGGGSSMITTPIWLWLGFPLPVAIATNTVGGTCWTLLAARNYLRGHEIDRKLLAFLASFGLIGAYGGTQVIVHCNPLSLQKVFGAIILSLVMFTFFRKSFGLEVGPERLTRFQTGLAALPLGFYEAFFGSGNGIFTSAVLTSARGFLLLQALGYYYLVAFVWCLFAASIYISGGNWDLSLMVPAVLGSLCGASLGSRIGVKKGAHFVKTLFMTAGAILGIKLLFF